MTTPVLYRKRIIPEECILLKDDQILTFDEKKLVTKWMALKPKKDLHHGYSCYFLDRGFKISKFYTEDGTLMYWYCDIIKPNYNTSTNELIVTDLLADVIIYPNGFVKVVDLNELVPALESGGLSLDELKKTLLSLDDLLNTIYSGEFKMLQETLESFEK